MTEQISIFIDNKPGRLNAVTAILQEREIDIRAMTIANHRGYGVAKLLVSDPHLAHQSLIEQGFAAALQPVLAVVIADRPGGLHDLLEGLAERQINVLNAYGFVITPGQSAVWCLEVADLAQTARLVEARGWRVLKESELYQPPSFFSL